jgi:hypothetical protein
MSTKLKTSVTIKGPSINFVYGNKVKRVVKNLLNVGNA